jgi:chromosome segregation ATPase
MEKTIKYLGMVLALCLLVGCNSTTEDNLKEQVKAYNLELTRLNDINQELSISIEGMESEIELLEDSILGYDDDIQALKTENIIYEDEVSQYQSEMIDLSASLDRIKD